LAKWQNARRTPRWNRSGSGRPEHVAPAWEQDMTRQAPILLFVDDGPVLSSLEFALTLQGFAAASGAAEMADPFAAGCLVMDQTFRGDGLAYLATLRQGGCATPAVLLVTNPTPAMRVSALAAGAVLIEKPLLGEDLTQALREALGRCEAA